MLERLINAPSMSPSRASKNAEQDRGQDLSPETSFHTDSNPLINILLRYIKSTDQVSDRLGWVHIAPSFKNLVSLVS